MRTETYDIATPNISVKHITGSITIEHSEGPTIIEMRGRTHGGERMVEESEISCNGERIRISVARPTRGFGIIGRSHMIDITLRVPATAKIEISSVAGDVNVSGASEDLRINTVSGDVRLSHGFVHGAVKSISGDLHIDAPFEYLSTTTISGDVEITAHQGGCVELSTVSGDVEVLLVSGLTIDIDAKSVSGDLESQISLDTGGGSDGPVLQVSGKTVSGDLTVRRA